MPTLVCSYHTDSTILGKSFGRICPPDRKKRWKTHQYETSPHLDFLDKRIRKEGLPEWVCFVFASIMEFAAFSGACSALQDTLACASGKSIRSVRAALRLLESHKIICTLRLHTKHGSINYIIPAVKADLAIGTLTQNGGVHLAKRVMEYFEIKDKEAFADKGIIKKVALQKRREILSKPAGKKREKKANIPSKTRRQSSDTPLLYRESPTGINETTIGADASEEVRAQAPPEDAVVFFEREEKREEVREEASRLLKHMRKWTKEQALLGAQYWHSLSPERICKLRENQRHDKDAYIRYMVEGGHARKELERNQAMQSDFDENVKVAKAFVKGFEEDASKYTTYFTAVHLNSTGLEIYPKGGADTASNTYFLDFSESHSVFNKKLLEVGEKRQLSQCQFFDLLRSQFPGLGPDGTETVSSTPKSTKRELTYSNSYPSPRVSNPTSDQSKSRWNLPSPSQPPGVQRKRKSSEDPLTPVDQTSATWLSSLRMPSSELPGRMIHKSLDSPPVRFTTQIQERSSGSALSKYSTNNFTSEIVESYLQEQRHE